MVVVVSHHGHGDEREADRLQQAGDSAADSDAAQHMAEQRGEEEETRPAIFSWHVH